MAWNPRMESQDCLPQKQRKTPKSPRKLLLHRSGVYRNHTWSLSVPSSLLEPSSSSSGSSASDSDMASSPSSLSIPSIGCVAACLFCASLIFESVSSRDPCRGSGGADGLHLRTHSHRAAGSPPRVCGIRSREAGRLGAPLRREEKPGGRVNNGGLTIDRHEAHREADRRGHHGDARRQVRLGHEAERHLHADVTLRVEDSRHDLNAPHLPHLKRQPAPRQQPLSHSEAIPQIPS
eukprot:1180195-Prorocentrum_minimum.AAC.1